MSETWRSYLPFDLRRRTVRFLQPGMQLKLPIMLTLITIGFAAAFVWNGYEAYGRIYKAVLSAAPMGIQELIEEQSRNFLVTTSTIAAGYLLTMLFVCLAHLHRLIGPMVAVSRQVRALKNGDYSARIQLRKDDTATLEVAEQLNELARKLEGDEIRVDARAL